MYQIGLHISILSMIGSKLFSCPLYKSICALMNSHRAQWCMLCTAVCTNVYLIMDGKTLKGHAGVWTLKGLELKECINFLILITDALKRFEGPYMIAICGFVHWDLKPGTHLCRLSFCSVAHCPYAVQCSRTQHSMVKQANMRSLR